MSQRETVAEVSLQKWRGVNQRLQPTLVPDGFFADSRGIMFGYGENAERLPGKTLKLKVDSPILNIFVLQNSVIVQTLNSVRRMPLSELL